MSQKRVIHRKDGTQQRHLHVHLPSALYKWLNELAARTEATKGDIVGVGLLLLRDQMGAAPEMLDAALERLRSVAPARRTPRESSRPGPSTKRPRSSSRTPSTKRPRSQ